MSKLSNEYPLMTVAELAKKKGVSTSYICRLCRLPKTHPNYIESIKVHSQLYLISDEKILKQYSK